MHKKILLCCGHAGFSGVPIYVRSLIDVLESHEIYLATDINEGVFNDVGSFVKVYQQKRGLKSSYNLISIITNVVFLFRFIHKHKVDTIWAHSSGAILAARLVCILKRSKINLLITYHGAPFGPNRPAIRSLLMKVTEWLFLRIVKHECLIFISEEDKRLVEKISPANMINSRTINNFGVKNNNNIIDYSNDRDTLKFVNSSRVSRQKNLEEIPLLLARIITDKQIVMTFYGNKTDTPEFAQKIMAMSTGQGIRYEFKGEVPSSDLGLEHYDFYISTSLYEGFSLSMLDAMFSGLALVTSDVGGVQELESNVGYVFSYEKIGHIDADCLSQFILNVHVNKEDVTRHIRKNADVHFSREKWAAKNNEVLRQF